MAIVHCKDCGKDVELDHAYHAKVKGFLCESCHFGYNKAGWIVIGVMCLIGIIGLAASNSGPETRNYEEEGYGLHEGGPEGNRNYVLKPGGEIPNGRVLSNDWYDNHGKGVSKIYKLASRAYSISTDGLASWKGLVLKDEVGLVVVLIDHPDKGLMTVTIEDEPPKAPSSSLSDPQ